MTHYIWKYFHLTSDIIYLILLLLSSINIKYQGDRDEKYFFYWVSCVANCWL